MSEQLGLFETDQQRLADGSIVVRAKRLSIARDITVRAAMKLLSYKCPKSVYHLIETGQIRAWKPETERGNGKYRIDWQSVMDYKARRSAAAVDGEGDF